MMTSSLSSRTSLICCSNRWSSRKVPLLALQSQRPRQHPRTRQEPGPPQALTMAGDDRSDLVGPQRAELVDEADARIQLGVAREPPLQTRHAEQDEAQGSLVVQVAHLLQAGHLEAI